MRHLRKVPLSSGSPGFGVTPRAVLRPASLPKAPREPADLVRIAGAVLTKDQADLAALASFDARLVAGWIDAFRKEKLAAEANARYWSAAMAALQTAAPNAARAE